MAGHGLLPQRPNSWWSFRVRPEGIDTTLASLLEVEPDVVFPTFFGCKEESTDGRGIFDAVRAENIICGFTG